MTPSVLQHPLLPGLVLTWTAAVFFLFSGCTLAVDTGELASRDEGLNCTAREKVCPVDLEDEEGPRHCVDATSPANGCAEKGCRLCEVPGAVARCSSNGGCTVAICNRFFEDCDEDESNGCEVNIGADEQNCGACGFPCERENGVPACVLGQCELVTCLPGYGDCDEDPTNGCEANLREDLSHCGACDSPCDPCEEGCQ